LSRVKSALTRLCLFSVLLVAIAAGAGCGSDGGGGSGPGNTTGGRSGPDTEGALLTILNYGRAAQASEVCPLLSADYRKEIGGGNPKRCGTLGEKVLCPCTPQRLNASSLTVIGNTATADVTRQIGGSSLEITLVREGDLWKIDKLDPPKPT
jgi:hypothetical protein